MRRIRPAAVEQRRVFGIGCGGGYQHFFEFLMGPGFACRQEAGSQPYALGAERERGAHAPRIGDSTGRHDRNAGHRIANQGHHHHGGNSGPDVSSGFDTLCDKDVGAVPGGATRLFRRANGLNDQCAAILGLTYVGSRVAPEKGNRLQAFRERNLETLVLVEGHREVHRDRTTRQGACRADFLAHHIRSVPTGSEHAQSAGVGDGSGQFRRRGAPHRGLENGIANV